MRSILVAFLASVPLVFAQNKTFSCLTESQLDTWVPLCAQECQQWAFHSDGCDYDDIACHCMKTGYLEDAMAPCLWNSTCTEDDFVGK
jgi:hypothetical protein